MKKTVSERIDRIARLGEWAQDIVLSMRKGRKRSPGGKFILLCFVMSVSEEEVREIARKNGLVAPDPESGLRYLMSLPTAEKSQHIIMHEPLKSSDKAKRLFTSYVVRGERWIDATAVSASRRFQKGTEFVFMSKA